MNIEGILEHLRIDDLTPDMRLIAENSGLEIVKSLMIWNDFTIRIPKISLMTPLIFRYVESRMTENPDIHLKMLANEIGRNMRTTRWLMEQVRRDTMNKEWIGFDLDGTLAKYNGWQGEDHIGEPISITIEILKDLIAAGERVKILTARAYHGKEAVRSIKTWLKANNLPVVEITCIKDPLMKYCYDDRCVPVERNTGKILLNDKEINGITEL